MVEIRVPPAGESVTEAEVAEVLISSGEYVEQDQEVAILETEKASSPLFAPCSGVLAHTLQPGQVVKVGECIATVEPSEKVSKTVDRKEKQHVPHHFQAPTSSHHAREGIEELLKEEQADEKTEQKSSEKTPIENRKPMSRMRRTIAKRLVQAKNTTAMLTTFNEVDLSTIIDIRKREKEVFEKKHEVKLGFMSFFVKACCYALKELPDVNAYLDAEEIVYPTGMHVGIAVSTEKGLVVPVIRHAEKKTFAEIERTIVDFSKKARANQIQIDEMSGGTFTITNGGVFGSLLSTPILNTPQTAILGMHAIQNRPVVVDQTVVIRPMMYLALSYDHRLIDGKEAVTFLVLMKRALEDPMGFFVEEY